MISTRHFGTKAAFSTLALALAATTASPAATFVGRGPVSNWANLKAYKVLHSFAGPDGISPHSNLDLGIRYNGTTGYSRVLYGETEGGGGAFSGTIFSYTIDTAAFSSLYQFSGASDGGVPVGGLANNETNYFQYGATQFGVALEGGSKTYGTLFSVGANGKPTVIHTFTDGSDGSAPAGRLTRFTDGNYYGTTSTGGKGFGTIYRLTPSGQFTTIYEFTGGADGGAPQSGLSLLVNTNGNANVMRRATAARMVNGRPQRPTMEEAIARVRAMSSSQYVSPYLYGTTSAAGAGGNGTIYRITPSSGAIQTLYSFTGKLDGAAPVAKLTPDLNGNLYGSTTAGGSGNNGVIYKLAQGNPTPQVLYDFGNGYTGAVPIGQLEFGLNGILYGTASEGGASFHFGQGNFGDVFEINGTTFTDLHDFRGPEGGNPEGGLTDGGDGLLYGTTVNGGSAAQGTLFSIAQ